MRWQRLRAVVAVVALVASAGAAAEPSRAATTPIDPQPVDGRAGPAGRDGRAGPAPERSASGACLPPIPGDGPGAVDPFRAVRPEAAALNLEGKALYQRGQFSEARSRYQAAERADPDFGAPALNVACSFVRQERFGEATTEVLAILGRGYLPWSTEVLEAADLGALKVRPEWSRIEAALTSGRRAWAEGLGEDVLFVGRLRKLLGFGDSPTGVFVLGPRQEVFAWSPRTLRTRQLTSEEGRVVALRVSRDGQQAAYVVAEKVVRVARISTALRGVTLVVLDLRQLQPLGRQRLDGDLRRLDLGLTARGFWFASRVDGSPGQPHAVLRFERGAWMTGGAAPDPGGDGSPVTLTPVGVAPTGDWHELGGASGSPPGAPRCRVQARDALDGAGARVVEIRPSRGHASASGGSLRSGHGPLLGVGGPHGAGLFGLPL